MLAFIQHFFFFFKTCKLYVADVPLAGGTLPEAECV